MIKNTIRVSVLASTVIAFAAGAAIAGGHEKAEKKEAGTPDIVETAQAAGSFETLVSAVKAAGLVETLKGKGPFTVLAPTDDAFARLPQGTIENLLKPENRDMLQSILTYHVIPGKVMAADVAKLQAATTVEGSDVTIRTADKLVLVNDAIVVKTDVEASNGVIHVIDTVILPKTEMKAEE